jgi:CheY-like chemotaxis protein/anti-sigma regulatory factor (Ser/Thr protein kinase)
MKRIKVFTAIDSEILEIETDERKLKQIIVNLLSNAVKFTPDGGEIGLEVKWDKEKNIVDFIVWDRGIGISPEDTDRLFMPFVQLDSSLSRHYSGTGLGLALVRSLTELLGGTVSLESEIGKGSSFTVSIPWKKTGEKDFLKKALIIEDSRPYSNLIAHFLKKENIKSIIHPLGYRALEKVLEVSPDLIILDIMLSDISGWDVLEQLKAGDSTKDIPVIIISAIDDHSRGFSMGVADYLVKPVSYDQFIKSVKRVFSLKEEVLPPVSVEREDKKQKVILIAEDNKENIMLYSDYIEAKGYKIITADNGKKAIKLVKEKEPDLILMDIQMPEMDGIEAIRHIRKMEQNTHIPIIALTSLAMVGDREKCITAGADDYAAKPVNLKRLMEMIEKCLSMGEKE